MRRLAPLAALVLSCACTESSLDLEYRRPSIALPHAPGPTPAPTATPFEPGALPSDTGDGHDGDLIVASLEYPNTCMAVLAAAAGGAVVTLDEPVPAGVAAGDRVLLWQVQDAFAMIGDGAPVASPGGAGLFEIARITALGSSSITVDPALANGYTSTAERRAQVCTIPELDDVTITATGTLSASPWDGARGGVVAFFSAGTLTIDGPITATALGFRGGPESNDANGTGSVVNLTTNQNNGGGKGEGLDPSGVGSYGRGNYANAAGGGNSRNAGGGGGGGAGAGGDGGKQNLNIGNVDGTKGMGGAAIATAVTTTDLRLAMGGGGGGGHINDGLEADGGNGGGLVLIFAATVNGSATVSANGAPGTGNGNGTDGDGGGGGGAGGMIVLMRAGGSTFTGALSARGGNGGDLDDTTDIQGPGGGGGGGWVITNDAAIGDAATLSGGAAGENFNGDDNGAQNGDAGVSTTL